uniref:Uncharacterized protein n=1 Tax=Arundo donax TaxID=35708 RepID=A0A0A9BAP9_ARUDO
MLMPLTAGEDAATYLCKF